MKVIFVGPSLSGLPKSAEGCKFLPPAAQGDIARAVLDGAEAIGLIDGVYETVAAVWHKEILFALERGVRVLGAASMGALRAAECADFGMEPVGDIAARYLSGELDDDAAVAVVHAPAEVDYLQLSEPLVDVEATLAALAESGAVSSAEQMALWQAARRTFFKERTVERIVAAAGIAEDRASAILAAYEAGRASPKQRDALALVDRMARLPPPRESNLGAHWQLAQPASWRDALADLRSPTIGNRPNI